MSSHIIPPHCISFVCFVQDISWPSNNDQLLALDAIDKLIFLYAPTIPLLPVIRVYAVIKWYAYNGMISLCAGGIFTVGVFRWSGETESSNFWSKPARAGMGTQVDDKHGRGVWGNGRQRAAAACTGKGNDSAGRRLVRMRCERG